MVQLVKCFRVSTEDLSLVPKTHVKKLGGVF